MNYKQIGDYIYYLKPIAKGNFSLIYKGYNSKNNTQVVIKQNIKLSNIQVKNELFILQKLNHINIIKFYDEFHTNDKIFFILEYCNNGTLEDYIKSKNNIYDEKYIFEILFGFEYLHKNKVMHRDIKPSNFLIHNNQIKISDFGFSKIETIDLSNTFCGSPMYMAPEILMNKKYTNKSDLWSLGISIYETLFKEYPYKNQESIIKNIISEKEIIIPPNEILDDLLSKLLIKNPDNRIDWEELFKLEWYVKKHSSEDDFELSFNELFDTNENQETDIEIDYDENFIDSQKKSSNFNLTGDIDTIICQKNSLIQSIENIKTFFSL